MSSLVASLLWPDSSICTGFALVVFSTSGFCEVVVLDFSVVLSRLSSCLLRVASISVFCLVSSPPVRVYWAKKGLF